MNENHVIIQHVMILPNESLRDSDHNTCAKAVLSGHGGPAI